MQPNLHILGIVLNKVDLRRSLTKVNLKECKRVFGKSLFSSWISNDTAIPNSLQQNIPLRELKWRSRTVSQLSKLTLEIFERMGILNGSR